MKTTRVGGGHPGYRTIEDPDPEDPEAARASYMQDPWHYSIARMVDACAGAGILPFYGPFGDIKDTAGCETQFRAAFLLGCVGAWSLHPVQIEIAKKVFSPPPEEVRFAKKVLEAALSEARGFGQVGLWRRGVDVERFKPDYASAAMRYELAELAEEDQPRLFHEALTVPSTPLRPFNRP